MTNDNNKIKGKCSGFYSVWHDPADNLTWGGHSTTKPLSWYITVKKKDVGCHHVQIEHKLKIDMMRIAAEWTLTR